MDFRKKDGRTYAGREVHRAMDREIAHSIIEEIDYPATVSDALFVPR
jgi:hypothetical protein